jgi:prepilin-type N-terminal cleavage/methylation domain-containing protein
MRRSGFTIVELIVATMIISILMLTINGLYTYYLDIERKTEAKRTFSSFIAKVQPVINEDKRIAGTLTTDRGVVGLDNLVSDNDLLWKSGLQNMSFVLSSDSTLANKQAAFLGINNYDVFKSGTRYMVIVKNKVVTSNALIDYQYKSFTFIDIGPKLSKYLRKFESDPNKYSAFLSMILNETNNGYNLNYNAGYDAVTNSSATVHPPGSISYTYTKLALMKEILSVALTTGGANEEMLKRWDEVKYEIQIETIDNSDSTRKMITKTIENVNQIAKNIEEWALIQSRVAAYDSLNGNNMDRDYFITCDSNGGNDCQTETIVPTSGSVSREDIDISKTLLSSTSSPEIMEQSANNGFFMCQGLVATASYEGIACDPTKYWGVINGDAESSIKFSDSTEDFYTITGALPISTAGTPVGENVLNQAVRKMMSSTKMPNNTFGYPIYFTNAGYFKISNDSNIDNLMGSTSLIASYTISKPFINQFSSPPYNAMLITIFPNFAGGVPGSGVSGNVSNTGFGLYIKPIFAHTF